MLSLAIDSLFSPRAAIRRVFAWQVDVRAFYLGAALLACISGVVNGLVAPMIEGTGVGPLVVAVRQLFLIAVLTVGIDRIGRAFGGTGDFDGALRVVVWHGAVEVLSTAVVIVAAMALGPIGNLALVFLLVWLFVVLVIFVQELHGFRSMFMTIVGFLGAGVVIGIPLWIVMGTLGLVDLEALRDGSL